MKVYERLRKYRIDRGITQVHIAAKLNKPVQRLNALELGRIKLTADEFEEICIKGFEINPGIFFSNQVLETKNNSIQAS